MMNVRLINHIIDACDKFKQKEISLVALQAALEDNGSALEGVDKSVYAKLHDFSNVLEKIRFNCLFERQYDETCNLIKELQKYLRSLNF